jgi:hypothetical protein
VLTKGPSKRANAQRKSTRIRSASSGRQKFRRIARENGVAEVKLEELDETHCKGGSQEKLLHALKTLMIGEGDNCTTVAQELASQAGLSSEIFEEMAVYTQATTRWISSRWEQQLQRTSQVRLTVRPGRQIRTGSRRITSTNSFADPTVKVLKLSNMRKVRWITCVIPQE